MSRKSNLAVVEDSVVVEDERQADIETAVADAAPAKPPRKPREARAAYTAGGIEDDLPPPARLVKKTLAELIAEIPAGKSRVIIGTKPAGVLRAAKAGGFEVLTGPVDDAPESVRVWRV